MRSTAIERALCDTGRAGYCGPWHVPALERVPRWTVVARDGGIEGGRFVAEPYLGRRVSEVFAYLGVPPSPRPVPGMVCLHAGDGRAYRRWVARWIAQGVAAIAVDLGGRGAGGEPLTRGGPPLAFDALLGLGLAETDMWTYHAVAAAVLGHGLLASRAGVDPRRVGVTGISWGGALACVVAGLDRRTACAIPVFGTGFLLDPSGRERSQVFDRLPPARRSRWHRRFDPAMFLPSCRCPVAFVTGTADGGFPLDILRRSQRLIPVPSFSIVHRELDHGHEAGWSAPAVDRFARAVLLRGDPGLPRLADPRVVDGRAVARCDGPPAIAATLLWTADGGPWKDRRWHETAATVAGGRVSAPVPAGARALFFNVETADGAWASTPHWDADDAVEGPGAGAAIEAL